ncbi:MAG: GtrA family protein [Saprospiraceae bacterium]
MKNKDELLDEPLENSDLKKKSNTKEFLSAQVAAFIGTAVDFGVVIFLTEIIGLWYVASNAIGATCGAITNFFLGRNWVFSATQNKISHQAFRYFLVATGSMILNTLGVYLLTEFTSLNYIYSKIIVAIIIAFTFNFLLQKYFVFQ